MAEAIGFIETKGLVGAIVAADAMLKSADITLVGKEITGSALVLVKIKGDLASVKYAIEAGETASKNAGNFISSLVMAEPDPRLTAVLPEINIEKIPDLPEKEEITNTAKDELHTEANGHDSVIADNADAAGTPSVEVNESISGGNDVVLENEPLGSKDEKIKKEKKSKSEPKDHHATLFDSLYDPTEEKITDYKPAFNSTIERLKSEALGIDNQDKNSVPAVKDESVEAPEENAPNARLPVEQEEIESDEPAPVKKITGSGKAAGPEKQQKKKNEQNEPEQKHESDSSHAGGLSAEISIDYLQTLNVHLLRKAARGVSGFPIQGREISKANRQVLLDYFSKLL
jgi:ethanolamine utilization protein EutM